jgi:hypothetical protein
MPGKKLDRPPKPPQLTEDEPRNTSRCRCGTCRVCVERQAAGLERLTKSAKRGPVADRPRRALERDLAMRTGLPVGDIAEALRDGRTAAEILSAYGG